MELEIFGVVMTSWQILVSLGIAFMLFEIFAPGFVFFPIGVAMITTSIFTLFVSSPTWQLVILAVNIIVVFMLFQKLIKPKFKKSQFDTNAGSMIGKEAEVTEEITVDNKKGYVKLYGDLWRALNVDKTHIPIGKTVVIEKIDGNKVYVRQKMSE